MVYTQINLIRGFVATAEDLAKYRIGEEEDQSYDLKNEFVSVFSFGCCSKSRGKLFIAGMSRRIYVRVKAGCGKIIDPQSAYKWFCGVQRLVCDTCIGETDNGNYDVQAILDGPVVAPDEHICPNCYEDNRTTFEVCRRCRYPKTDEHERMDNQIKQVIKDMGGNPPIHYFYMLDDCLSCT